MKSDAKYIFELVNKFAGYGFNKSHAAAYGLVSYHTAYMKANYPEEFLAASMTLDMSNTDKLAQFAAEARRHGIEVKPPCVNASDVDFLAEPAPPASEPLTDGAKAARGAIRYSLAALRNIGASAVSTIVTERTAKGRYKSLDDFATRLNPKAINKRALETLAAAGALDALEKNRALVSRQRRSALERGRADRGRSFDRAGQPARPDDDVVGRRFAHRSQVAPDAGVDADGALEPRVRCGRLLSLRPSARRVRSHPAQARRQELRGDRGADRARRRRKAALPASSSPRASASRSAATSSPSRCSPTRPDSSRR